jgi:hypothetical protein
MVLAFRAADGSGPRRFALLFVVPGASPVGWGRARGAGHRIGRAGQKWALKCSACSRVLVRISSWLVLYVFVFVSRLLFRSCLLARSISNGTMQKDQRDPSLSMRVEKLETNPTQWLEAKELTCPDLSRETVVHHVRASLCCWVRASPTERHIFMSVCITHGHKKWSHVRMCQPLLQRQGHIF